MTTSWLGTPRVGARRARGTASARLLAGVVLVTALLAACSGGSGASIGPPGPQVGATLDQAIPSSIANLQLTTDSGAHTSLADFRGKTVILTDFLTLCSDACPLVSQELADIDRQVLAAGLQNQVQLLELTVDPQRDTPARLAAYRKVFDAPANWSLLTATPQTIEAVWGYFHVYYQRGPTDDPGATDWWTGNPLTYDVAHGDDAIFIDTSGHWRYLIDGLPNVQGQQLPSAMRAYLDTVGTRRLDHPSAGTWTTPQALQVLSWLTGTRIG